jgi:hypothetical protein
MIWLRDLAVAVERAADRRTARVLVSDNDAGHDDERPPMEGAEVLVEAHRPGEQAVVLARGRTDRFGVFGFPTPSDLDSGRIAVAVTASGRSPRRLLLDGTNLALDLREVLYGVDRAARP